MPENLDLEAIRKRAMMVREIPCSCPDCGDSTYDHCCDAHTVMEPNPDIEALIAEVERLRAENLHLLKVLDQVM